MNALKRFFIRNWPLKLLALILSFFLWITLIPEEKIFSEKTYVVPLEMRNLPTDYEFVDRPSGTIDVTIQAPNRLLGQMTTSDVKAALDLSRASLNQEDYPLNPDIVSLPQGAKAVRVFPNTVRLKLARSVEVLMEIQPFIVGKVDPDWKVDRIEAIPPKVSVRGPESSVSAKDRVRTGPVDISGLTESKTFDVDLLLPRPELRFQTGQTRASIKVFLVPK